MEEVGIGSGRGNVQTLHGPYAGRAERARCAERAQSAWTAPARGLAVRSGCARGYEPLHDAEKQAAERGRACEWPVSAEKEEAECGRACEWPASAEKEEAGICGIAPARRCEPLP